MSPRGWPGWCPTTGAEWLWNTLRIANLVLLGIPMAGLAMGLGAAGSPEDIEKWVALVRRPVTGGALPLTGLMGGIMGGIIGGLSVGFGAETEECWTPRGAVGRLVVYGLPFLPAVPWLSGSREIWSGAFVALAALWLLIAPVNKVAKHIPSVSSD
ncbi:hypothetical protein [Streptomyces sp. P17]|uniref:hypothetical protein n=1 Tax=Streptomyces sp. P17 TaxID=3074716 RepID=UPI0028F4334E|nr:hypothetical protein [Streptomyces sp. P17]MDT9696889.1 hypothetical protein [Streptomyces sp. P17]